MPGRSFSWSSDAVLMSSFSAFLLAAWAAEAEVTVAVAKRSATATAIALRSLTMCTSSRLERRRQLHERLQAARHPLDAGADHRIGSGERQPQVAGLAERRTGHDGHAVLLEEHLRQLHVVGHASEIGGDVAEQIERAFRAGAADPRK